MAVKLRHVEFDRPVKGPGKGDITSGYSVDRAEHKDVTLELVDAHGHKWVRIARKGVDEKHLCPIERVTYIVEEPIAPAAKSEAKKDDPKDEPPKGKGG